MSIDTYSCEVWIESNWTVVTVEVALAYPTLTKRCMECHGHIKLMRAGPKGKPRAHPEHHKRHSGCSLGDCFDGKKTPHPKQVQKPNKPGALIPYLPEEIIASSDFEEGATTSVTVNAYERNPKARAACLKHYGYNCFICDFNFEKAYGSQARNIIHVHHIKPLSKIGGSYLVNPIKDLRPVCPNCHAVIHCKSDAYDPEEVKVFIKQATRA